ncbi:MAG: 5-(carboxyamino)imidazole ribonucleotide synthase [Gammaproteobacteria bacterium]|nr:5-(carboxyamino)imidazole ribonucleotide synthase [Gammaproteobacteria bacterium]
MKRLGVIGAGQLGRMLGTAAARLGIDVTFLDPAPSPPAAQVGPVICEPFDSTAGLEKLAGVSDLLTYEFENVPVEALEALAGRVAVFPPTAALRHAQDRWHEKQVFESLGIPVPQYCRIDSRQDLVKAAAILGFPIVLKTRTLGYDGKGQRVIKSSDDIQAAWQALGSAPLIAEQWVKFDYEVSVIGARRQGGQIVVYPLTENQHRDGILRVSLSPARNEALLDVASEYLTALLDKLDYVGVLALELFVRDDGLLANEFAPRVHNSGHWTIEGAATSQFENHLRAIFDLPLGDTSAIACAGMLNLIGRMPDTSRLPADFPFFLHDYGKSPRPGRKLGHITVLAENRAGRDQRLAKISNLLTN